MDVESLTRWVEGYVRAWNTNEPADIGALFTPDATYRTTPYAPPLVGREVIVADWLARADKPGETTFRWTPLIVGDGVGIVQGETSYPQVAYSNLWVVRLADDGRCTEFTEWWMEQPETH